MSIAAENLCGLLMLAPHYWPLVAQIVRPEMAEAQPSEILTAFEKAAQNAQNRPLTTADVITLLSPDTKDAALQFAELFPRGSVDADNAQRYAQTVAQDYTAAKLTARVMQALPGGAGDLIAALDEIRAALDEAKGTAAAADGVKPLSECLVDFLAELQRPPAHVPSGFALLDKHIGGFKPGDVDVIAGRSGAGKSDFALAIALRLASAGHKVLYESLEMSGADVAQRLVSAKAQVNSAAIRSRTCVRNSGMMDDISTATDLLYGLPLLVDAPSSLNPNGLEARIFKHRPEVVIVDNLDLMRPTRQLRDKWQAVEETSHSLKAIATRQQCCILELVQLNRVTDRDMDAPKLGDLYGGSSLEHDASTVLALQEAREPFSDTEAHMIVHILKVRDGRRGRLDFSVNFSRHTWTEVNS
jgi:replicative DNA helicase